MFTMIQGVKNVVSTCLRQVILSVGQVSKGQVNI